MFHGFNNVEFYDSLAASRCFGGAVLLGRPRFVEHVHAPCCRTSFISWLCLGKRNIHHDWGIQKRNLYESVLFCVILWGAQKSKQIQAIKWKESWLVRCSLFEQFSQVSAKVLSAEWSAHPVDRFTLLPGDTLHVREVEVLPMGPGDGMNPPSKLQGLRTRWTKRLGLGDLNPWNTETVFIYSLYWTKIPDLWTTYISHTS